MTLLDNLSLYLGVQFFYQPWGILMSHAQYILKSLVDLGLEDCHSAHVPMNPGLVLTMDMSAPLIDPTYYRVVVGKLRHCTVSRYDVSFAVGIVSRFLISPQEPHLAAAIQIWRYLKTTVNFAIYYRQGESVEPSGYSNSDYAGDADERKSTAGYILGIGSAPTTWNSKKQGEVTRSSAEAEYRAAAEATKEALWLRNLLSELKISIPKPVSIGCDNQSCICMATNLVLHERTKHIEAQCYFIRDNIRKERINLTSTCGHPHETIS